MERSLICCKRVLQVLCICCIALFFAVGALASDNDTEESAPVIVPAEDDQSTAKPLNEVYLDADEISYDEYTGVAVAEGNVRVRNKEVRLFAPHAEYNSETNIVDAYSDYRENVVIISGAEKMIGKHLKYNMQTRRGVLTEATGQSQAMYMQGGRVKLMPVEEAIKLGIVRATRKMKKKKIEGEVVAQWLGVTATTCDFTNPHYRLVSKKVVMYPQRDRTVLKSPKFYIGKKLVMSYPFDYIAGKKNKNALMPIVRYNSDKGLGLGIRGPIDVGEWGEFDIAALYWTDGFWETRFRYTYDITEDLMFFATLKRLYNDDTDDVLWRPSTGVDYVKNGWEARLWWAERDLTGNEVETDVSEDYDVWRKPEFFVNTPWVGDGFSGHFRLFGIWGRYTDNKSRGRWYDRFAYGAEYRGDPEWSLGIFKPFYGVRYTHYDYYEDDKQQDVTKAWFGFNYNIGAFRLSSSYEHRWGTRGSPMRWDRFGDQEKYVQRVAMPLPFGESWEKWDFAVQSTYDILKSKISSMRYTLTYDKHCTTWQVWYRDNRSDDETFVGVTFFINAYPEYKIELGSDDNSSTKEDF